MTNMDYVLILLSLFCFILQINGIPLRCTEVTSTYFYDDRNGLNMYGIVNGSAILSVYKRDHIQYVSARNVDVIRYQSNSTTTANQTCEKVGHCSTDLSKPFEMQVGNQSLSIFAFFPQYEYGSSFFNGLVDDKGFFNFDGSFYTPSNPCSTTATGQSDLIKSETHCCTVFEAAPQAPANSPRCAKFQSRSSILNVDDNYSILATSNLNITMLGASLSGKGRFTGPNNISIEYDANNNKMCGNLGSQAPEFECYRIRISYPDGKMLISAVYIQGILGGPTYSGMLGRILFRDGQILMEEGVPFSPENNCYYQSYPYAGMPNHVVNNQFCCVAFDTSFEHEKEEIQN
jgi:hypothetical protein